MQISLLASVIAAAMLLLRPCSFIMDRLCSCVTRTRTRWICRDDSQSQPKVTELTKLGELESLLQWRVRGFEDLEHGGII